MKTCKRNTSNDLKFAQPNKQAKRFKVLSNWAENEHKYCKISQCPIKLHHFLVTTCCTTQNCSLGFSIMN